MTCQHTCAWSSMAQRCSCRTRMRWRSSRMATRKPRRKQPPKHQCARRSVNPTMLKIRCLAANHNHRRRTPPPHVRCESCPTTRWGPRSLRETQRQSPDAQTSPLRKLLDNRRDSTKECARRSVNPTALTFTFAHASTNGARRRPGGDQPSAASQSKGRAFDPLAYSQLDRQLGRLNRQR